MTAVPYVHHEVVIGRSVEGRAIRAWEIGDPTAKRVTLVVGCIHGTEPAGIAIAQRLLRTRAPKNRVLWIVPNLNPDGTAAGTRGNAHGVDLNRNFPYRWRDLEGTFDSGPHALSEPESRAAWKLIERVHPTTTIWFHQHMDLVDLSGGNESVERHFARVVGMRVKRLGRYDGSAPQWQDHQFPGTTAFVVELPAGPVPSTRIGAFVRGVDAVA